MIRKNSSGAKKAFISRSGWFSLHHPAHWEVDEDEYIAVYDPENGVGALHVSAYEAPETVDPRAELLEHLSQDHPSIRLEDLQTWVDGPRTIASFESIADGSFDKVWFIAQGSYLVIATYNSDAEDKDKEEKTIEEIIHSIEIVPGLSRN
jgi:hypothetical protein